MKLQCILRGMDKVIAASSMNLTELLWTFCNSFLPETRSKCSVLP